jgi:hypothetical protein
MKQRESDLTITSDQVVYGSCTLLKIVIVYSLIELLTTDGGAFLGPPGQI